MNATGVNILHQPICVTCLSQDRKLFPVTRSSFLFNLSEGATLCWECHFFVQKVAAFQRRALKAQEFLASAQHLTNVTKIKGLSSLMVTPIYLDVSIEKPHISQSNIKMESIKEECVDIAFEYSTEYTCNSIMPCNESTREMDGDKSLLPVLNKQTEAEDDEGNCGEAVGDDIANASLKSLLSRKSSLIMIPPLGNKHKHGILATEMEEVLEEEMAIGESENMFDECFEATCHSDKLYSDESSEEMGGDILLPVLNKQTEAKGDEGVSGEAISDDIANASLKSLLCRKSAMIMSSHLAMKLKDTLAEKDIIEIPEKEETTDKEIKQTALSDPVASYTVVLLSEEEMLKWRERKKNMPEYATKAAALRCERCIEPFKNMKIYMAHARRHREDYGDFACRICGLRSVDESALRAHTGQHYRLLKCKLCAYEWDGPNALRQHCSKAHGIPVTTWECDQCDRKYESLVQLARHSARHRVATCAQCGARVAQTAAMQHLRLHSSVPRTCAVCGKECRGDDKLAAHMKSHDPKVDEAAYCAECNMQFRTMAQYRNHLRFTLKHAGTNDRRFKCSECGKAFLTRASLANHADIMHNVERKYPCAICGQKFKSRPHRNRHVGRVHRHSSAKYICDYCGKAFKTKRTLHTHINTHTGARPFACALCDATFGHESALYLHGRYKHKIKKKNEDK